MSFKIIDVDISKKLVVSACCNKQHVCAICNYFYARKQLLLSARFSHRNSVCLVCLVCPSHGWISQNGAS